MHFRRWYRRYRTLFVSLLACAAFLALAVYGWGVNTEELALALIVTLVSLGLLLVVAALVGWALYRIKNRRR